MKNVSRNKFLVCFRPVVGMDLMLESEDVVVDRSQNHHALKYVGVKNKEHMKPSATKSSVCEKKNSITIHRPGKKTFSQVIKAVVFEFILVKKFRDGKGIDQESCSSKHDFPLRSRDQLLATNFDESVNKVLAGKGIHDTIFKSGSVSSRSSCSSSSSSSSSSFQKSAEKTKREQLQNNCSSYSNHQDGEMKPKQNGAEKGSSSISVILLLFISLAVTIFWGRFCAILLTSIWLCFLPRQQPTGVIGIQENIKETRKRCQRDHKKVIMEGLLKSNQNRGLLNF